MVKSDETNNVFKSKEEESGICKLLKEGYTKEEIESLISFLSNNNCYSK